MKKVLSLLFFIFGLAVFVSGQILVKPKQIATWSYSGDGDYLEFLDNTGGRMFEYYAQNPNSKAVALICFKGDLATALVSSVGFPLYFFEATQVWKIPAENVFLARSGKCEKSSKATDQYWVVPENSHFQNDEMLLAKNVSHERWSIGYYENYKSQKVRNEFNENIKNFLNKLIVDPKSQGFIVSRLTNAKTEKKIQIVLGELKKHKLEERVKTVRKKMLFDLYPELITVTVNQ